MKIRQSNMELLRIIAILMITTHHYLIGTGYWCIVDGENLTQGWQWATIINSFMYIGVNVFVLISGYFGIKFKWKGVLNLFIFCAFYMFLNLLLSTYVFHEETLTIGTIFAKSLKALTRTSKWFIPCYLVLYFLAPLLNTARENLTKNQYLYGLIILSVYCFWFGFIRQVNIFNHNGYTVGQFIWLYFIGGYISRFEPQNKLKHKRVSLIAIYVLCCLCWAGLTIAKYEGVALSHWHPTTYNNPFILIGAIAFFCLFTTFDFHSKVINYFAQSALAVYLFGLPIAKFGIVGEDALQIGVGYLLIMIGWVLLRFAVSVSVDQIRVGLMIPVNWIWNNAENLISKKLSILRHE
ncbi:MAG: acyltransferase [Paludibacteraceae bacterium]|nr:acyltransferase [Paludibacteraceae bacterium]